MKYAFMSFSTPALSLGEMLDTARRYGYDGVEPRLDAGHAHGIEAAIDADQRRAIRETVEASGVALACLATSLTYADPTVTDEMIMQTRERIDLAADVGAPTLRVFGGKIGGGLEREAAVELVASCLSRVADQAGERGLILCIETHDDWCNPADVAAVIGRVNHSAVAVNWDIMHPVRQGFATIEESYRTLKPWVRHLHAHDGLFDGGLKLVAIGQGGVDHRKAVKLLQADGYDGYLSGEWINWEDPYDVHLPRELAALRGYERAG